MPHLNPLYVKVEHVTKINAGVCDFTATIAHAMTTLPLSYPQIVGYSMQHIARVAHGIDTDLSLGDFLSKRPLTIIYDIPEPLSATPPNDPSLLIMIANLQAKLVTLQKGQAGLEVEVEDLRRNLKVEVAARKVEGAVQKVEVEDLRARFDLFTGSTQPTLPVILRILLDAHLMQLGFIPYCLSRSQFVLANLARLAAATGVPQNQVVAFFQYVFISLFDFLSKFIV
jgi:hypothetical protein